ncbi:uncharacterized protein LOC129919168 [Episyrphus balteatus]|uniref:uncharacterized protein LOC129919168 n=1 Tax=Episyrphus balteatus TaxID=286459 RepID=UPI002485EAB4|nr:uncharacterized protein LOC129919168 [Episyrphus balteatus]
MVDQQNMPKCQKMWYLKTNVNGEAEKLIRHLPLTEDSYDSAWKMLQDRYNNKRMLTTALLNRLLQQTIISIESASSIKALHDVTKECLQGLTNLGLEICSWDPLIVHLLIRKLDRTTHSLYEQSMKHPKSLPSLDEFMSFLETRFHSLETLGNKGRYSDDQRKPAARSFTSVEANKSSKTNCPLCNGSEHKLYSCIKFLRLSLENRLATVKKFRLCTNCLNPGHLATRCIARNCTRCAGKHNTLLHMGNPSIRPSEKGNDQPIRHFPQKTEIELPSTSSKAVNPAHTSASAVAPKQKSYVFLSTVVVDIKSSEGTYISARALLDSGSQLNFITENLSKRLNILEFAETMRILGIGEGSKRSDKRVNITLKSKTTYFAVNFEAFVLRQITPSQPSRMINIESWNIPKDIKLQINISMSLAKSIYY